MAKVATQPLPPVGGVPTASEQGAKSKVAHEWARWLQNHCRLGASPTLQRGGQNQKWPISGQGGYKTTAAWGVLTASERGVESKVAHKWARWLHNPCRLWGSHHFRARGQDQKWPISGQGGYTTPAAWGVPTALERGVESKVAHKWARWLHNSCRLGGSYCFRAGG